jgi:hypothetical protein
VPVEAGKLDMKNKNSAHANRERQYSAKSLVLLFLTLLTCAFVGVAFAADLGDDFNDGVRDASKWKLGVLRRSSSEFDPMAPVTEENGQLKIAPRAGLSGSYYNGYVTATSWDMRGARATVQVVQIASDKAATIFSVGIDKDNWYSFRAKGTTLYLEKRILKSTSAVSISFSATQHRFWRFRHDQALDSIVFETSSDGATWTARRTVSREIPIGAMRCELNAGTSEIVSTPGAALFDNFQLEYNGPSPTPTPTASPTATPTPTPLPTASPTPTAIPTPIPSPTPNTSRSRGYLTTPAELREIKSKSDRGIDPYQKAVTSLLNYVGQPDYWPYGFVDPTNRDVLQRAAALVYAKGLAYCLTGDVRYAASVREKILELSTTNTCSNTYSGSNGCILTLSRHIPGYIAAADLIEDYAGWYSGDKTIFQIWLRDKIYRFTDWASDDRSTNWGSVGSASTQYIADYFTGSGLILTDRNGAPFSPHDAYWEARQRALDRMNSNPYMGNSVCTVTTGLGIRPYGGIPEETGRGSTGCDGTYLLADDDSYSYMQTHLSGTVLQAELLLRRGDSALFDNIKADGGGSILKAILYVIENPNDPTPPNHWWNWINSRKSILEIAYRYYGHPAIGKQLGIATSSRHIAGDGNSSLPHFATLTHGFAVDENPARPPVTPAP